MDLEKVRLYRAITDRENEGIYSLFNGVLLKKYPDDLLIADEIYSHALNSHKLRQGPIYSFTDSLSVAKEFILKHPSYYKAIGYVDISIKDDCFQLPEDVIYLKRMCEFSDWLDLAATANLTEFNNLNYKSYPAKITNLLIPSQKSVYSWSSKAREYMAICSGLVLTTIDDYYIEPQWCKDKESFSPKIRYSKTIADFIENNIDSLNIHKLKKDFVKTELNEYKKNINSVP
ncbi:hypothetical protein [Anaerosporobacter sp.]|uniref:hypothetical protein n=1 Tax=Anaerosporobacter sp. TaxID=1872529 RepID=UPI00286F4FAB|nr:hypothetical protein [Anaerosporobacter sp.]